MVAGAGGDLLPFVEGSGWWQGRAGGAVGGSQGGQGGHLVVEVRIMAPMVVTVVRSLVISASFCPSLSITPLEEKQAAFGRG